MSLRCLRWLAVISTVPIVLFAGKLGIDALEFRPHLATSETEAGCKDEKVKEMLVMALTRHGIPKPIFGPAHGNGHSCEITISTETGTDDRTIKFKVLGPYYAPAITIWLPG
jgi:hypothetical protein